MKRLSCLLLASLLLLLTACSSEDVKPVYKDTLVITNDEKSFTGAEERCFAVIESMKTRVNLLEESHNEALKVENPDSYFLDENYIHRSFDPFIIPSLEITDKITESVNEENAASVFENEAGNSSVIFKREGEGYTLSFMNEGVTKSYTAEYDSKTDSFRFVYKEEGQAAQELTEFIEFVTVSAGVYAIQSNLSRCWIVFDENGNIESFTCSTLKDKSYSLDDSIYGASSTALTLFKSKIDNGKKTSYESVREYNEGVLTHIDTVEEKINEVQIYAERYASAFV